MSRHSRSLARLADDLDREKAQQSPYRDLARERKATTLAACLWAAASHERRRDPQLPSDVAKAPEAWWAAVADQAGVHAPSPETVQLVVEKVAALVQAERAALVPKLENDAPARVCLNCFQPIEGARPYPAAAPLWCEACEALRYAPRAKVG